MPNTIIEVKLQKTIIDIALGYLQASTIVGATNPLIDVVLSILKKG